MVGQVIALAKISRPKLFKVVSRPRLYNLLDERRKQSVVWVNGLPGVGKTTSVANYLDERKVPSIWYQMDSGDSDPETFFYYLRQAARVDASSNHKPLPCLTPEDLSDLIRFTRRFFREFYSRLPAEAVVVFDSYQEIPLASPLHNIIQEALSEIPAGVNVVVISHSKPPSQFVRMLANNMIGRIQGEEVRLTFDETAEIAAASQAFDEQTIRMLHMQCGGWTTGLVLILEAIKRVGTFDSIYKPDIIENVFNYFAEQIFSRLTDAARDLIVRIAFLPCVTAANAVAVSGNAQAEKYLDFLCARQMFIERRAGKEISYRCHMLFKAFLLDYAKKTYTTSVFQEISCRAASVLQQCGRSEDAIPLYLDAADWESATRLITLHAPTLIAQGRAQTIRDWIGMLPVEHLQETPCLLCWFSVSLIHIDPVNAHTSMRGAFEEFGLENQQIEKMLSTASVIQNYCLEGVTSSPMDEWEKVLEKLFPCDLALPSAEVKLSTYIGILLAAAYRPPAYSKLMPLLDEMLATLHLDLDVNRKVVAGFLLLTHYVLVGEPAKAQRVIVMIDPLVEQPAVTPLNKSIWLSRVGFHSLLSGEYKRATEYLEQTRQMASDREIPTSASHLYFFQMIMTSQPGNISALEQFVTRFEASMNPARYFDQAYLRIMKGGLAMAQGKLQLALRKVRMAVDLFDQIGFTFGQFSARGFLAQLHTEAGELEEATQVIHEARALMPEIPYVVVESWLMMIEAYVLFESGNLSSGRVILRDAFKLARRTIYSMAFSASGKILPRLCAEALEADIEVEYSKAIIRNCHVPSGSIETSRWPWPIKIYTLGGLSVVIGDEPLVFHGKAQRKPIELLSAVLANAGRGVDCGTLIDRLWPDLDGDSGRNAFDLALYRLRKLLKPVDALIMQDGKLTLDASKVWVDSWVLERFCERVDRMETLSLGKDDIDATAQQLLRLYPDCFLPGEFAPSTIAARERLHSKFLRSISILGQWLERKNCWHEAITLYRRAIELAPFAEEFHRRLMMSFREQGRFAEALDAYRRCQGLFSITLGVEPSPPTKEVYFSLKMQ
ncbi:MAG: BTAD domain-containing putative transcriptional regulator [Pseudomonadota bacterium]